jgi:hypothetical protein
MTSSTRSRWSLWSTDSFLCIACSGSALSIGSIGSTLSIGSVGSFGSVGSVGSALSFASALSWLSCGSVLSDRSALAVLGSQSRGSWAASPALAVVGLAVLTATLRSGPGRLRSGRGRRIVAP